MTTPFRRITDIGPVYGKRVLVRVDFNVPIDAATGEITDDSRIQGSLPTLDALVEQGARVIAVSHRGRPKGPSAKDSLAPVVAYLQKLRTYPVKLTGEARSDEAVQAVEALQPGELLVLENLRFDPGETANDPELARRLASFADLYVNDAFGTSHRQHASIVGVPKYLPAYAGELMAEELDHLDRVLAHPTRPYWAIIGGAKVSDKVKLLSRLLELVDGIIIGGGMANTFLAAQGYSMGASLVEEGVIPEATRLLEQAQAKGVTVVLPKDVLVAKEFRADTPYRAALVTDIHADEMALDIGPRTVETIIAALQPAQTVLWNGPMGVFEFEAFAQGTIQVAQALAALNVSVVVGGGDSVAAVSKAGVKDKMTHISTGGGATLRYLEGEELPGIQALRQPAEA
ncbi:phosphoglycerate kinase [Sulfobacillus sp. hq2]|uniref:Phosphoglycerate kinase n=1 Tax=Sulfobacillus thermotolerans TaxID=338644 RepID=A0ABM6RNT3_9FIRM|nr:phosphoglycerate kinase [Sulfobacillus sp. hq2]AUW93032.1 phosphoglycerate kinase [Sulfobacillus thermotolerans]MCY0908480.1 phosphoglycerate kinase [Sulfobacillus thermotolerans]POB11101.1 phosphoglycerate kinase [Sulfobacillus sp. hq2]